MSRARCTRLPKIDHAGPAMDLSFHLAWLMVEARRSGKEFTATTDGVEWNLRIGDLRTHHVNIAEAGRLLVETIEDSQ